MSSTRVQERRSAATVEAHSTREQAIDEFLAETDAEFGPVPDEVLAEVRAAWPE